jgi:hypothetical protein
MMWRGTEGQLLFMQLHFSPVLQSSDQCHNSEIHLMKLLMAFFYEMSNEMKIGLIKHYQWTIHLEHYPKFPKTGTETCYFILIL